VTKAPSKARGKSTRSASVRRLLWCALVLERSSEQFTPPRTAPAPRFAAAAAAAAPPPLAAAEER